MLFFSFLIELFADLQGQAVKCPFFELFLPEPFLKIQDFARAIEHSGVDFFGIKSDDFLVELTNIEKALAAFANREQLDLNVFGCQLLGSLD